MEAREEVMAMASYSSSSSSSPDEAPRPLSIKRSRTRRRRPISSASTATASSSASESGFTDEEDMANCLILLAQGSGGGTVSAAEKFTSKRFAEAAATAAGRAGFYVYECKTCSKCFPSFQALGGHRASHKKLKMAAEAAAAGEKKGVGDEITHLPVSLNSVSKRTESVGKGRVHECSICRSEFSSGQALGGHMRRHRPALDLPEELKKEKTVLALDLNLPAPAEDDIPFAIPGKPLVFSPAAPLVDCLY